MVLKKPINSSDVLIDPFRLGVVERLCLGPGVFLEGNGSNMGLVGHNLDHITLSGVYSVRVSPLRVVDDSHL